MIHELTPTSYNRPHSSINTHLTHGLDYVTVETLWDAYLGLAQLPVLASRVVQSEDGHTLLLFSKFIGRFSAKDVVPVDGNTMDLL